MGKTHRIKLTWTKEFLATVSTTSSVTTWINIVQPDGAYTYPVSAAPASMVFLGSHFCCPMGDPAAGGTGLTPTNLVEDYPSGLTDWSTFYTNAICFGSSIRISMYAAEPPNASTATLSRYVLLPFTHETTVDKFRPNDNLAGQTKALLDSLQYSDLMSYPGAQSGYIKSQAAGPTMVKGFRKTKSMLGMKDIKDNQDELYMLLPQKGALTVASNMPQVFDKVNSLTAAAAANSSGWSWYLRILPFTSTSNSDIIMFTIRMKYYAQLQDRTIILQDTIG